MEDYSQESATESSCPDLFTTQKIEVLIMFAVLLFVVYYICLVHLFAPASSNELSEKVTLPAQTIEQQLKEILWSDVEPEENEEVTAVTEVEEKPAAIADLLEGIGGMATIVEFYSHIPLKPLC